MLAAYLKEWTRTDSRFASAAVGAGGAAGQRSFFAMPRPFSLQAATAAAPDSSSALRNT